jgi:threonine synthase
VAGEIADDRLFEICGETVAFPIPLVPITDRISVLELFHGPTLAFKDVGARFMSRCLGHFSAGLDRKAVVIVATSGDTGSAVAAGFDGVENTEVVILFPKGKVSRVQELQLTAERSNVTTLEVRGDFDECQRLAKSALADPEIRAKGFLTSANSINVARWLPQQFYYLFAAKQLEAEPAVYSVPSGNFGNIAAGLLAFKAGMPAAGFVAACNANDVVPKFLQSGEYRPQPAVPTLSNAMDVGDPSNLPRVMAVFDNDLDKVKRSASAFSIDDRQTGETIREVLGRHGYLLDPHAAVGYRALCRYLDRDPQVKGVVLETAHPIKFESTAEAARSRKLPEGIGGLEEQPHGSTEIDPDYDAVREVVLSKV